MFTDDGIREIVSSWNLKYRRSLPEIDITGSPERTLHRVVIEDESSSLWVLEAVPPGSSEHKATISETLFHLRAAGLQTVHPHLRNDPNGYVVPHSGRLWQVRPYVKGVPLPRPSYVLDGRRGRACALFLADLRQKAGNMPFLERMQGFSMSRFIERLSGTMEGHDREVRRRLGPAFRFLDREFAGPTAALPTVFCHGDFHPLNIIWSEDGIRSVIDWEFLGYKPEPYDMANLIGCVGFEDPAALAQGFVTEFISQMRKVDAASDRCWEALPEWVVAVRFAWLSDWLRRRDRDMVDLEVAYINLLIDHQRDLKTLWGLPA